MRRLAVSAVLLSACATGSQSPSVSPQMDQTVRVVAATGSTGSTMAIAQNDNPSQRTVAASAAQVWNALPAVYDSLGLPVTDRNAEARSIGTTSLKVRRRLGDVPLSRYIDCGDTQGSPSANSYEVVLSVATRLAPAGDSTAVATTVNALARPVFVSGEYVNCGSTRALEKRFFDILDVELRR